MSGHLSDYLLGITRSFTFLHISRNSRTPALVLGILAGRGCASSAPSFARSHSLHSSRLYPSLLQPRRRRIDLICDANGQPLTKFGLRGAFERAPELAVFASQIAASEAGLPDISAAIQAFQFRDLRANAGTDTEELRAMAAAKDQLGHSS